MVNKVPEQFDLFPLTWKQIEEEYSISFYHAGVLYQEDYLSFNPEEKEQLYQFELAEFIFLKTLFFESGFSKANVNEMLLGLDKPYRYSFKDIYWDFQDNCWRAFEDKLDSYIDRKYPEIIEEYLGVYIDESEDMEYLELIIEHIDFRIQKYNEENE